MFVCECCPPLHHQPGFLRLYSLSEVAFHLTQTPPTPQYPLLDNSLNLTSSKKPSRDLNIHTEVLHTEVLHSLGILLTTNMSSSNV